LNKEAGRTYRKYGDQSSRHGKTLCTKILRVWERGYHGNPGELPD